MTETTVTAVATGMRPLWEAYDEAKRKNGWEKDGLTEKAVFALAFAKMMDARSKWEHCQSAVGFSLGDFFGWLHFFDGRKLLFALARSCVVYMTDKAGPIGRNDVRKMQALEEHLDKTAFWVVGECARGGYEWKVTKRCIDQLTIGAGCCTDDDWTRYCMCDVRPMKIPLPGVSKEAAEQMVAWLKKVGGTE